MFHGRWYCSKECQGLDPDMQVKSPPKAVPKKAEESEEEEVEIDL